MSGEPDCSRAEYEALRRGLGAHRLPPRRAGGLGPGRRRLPAGPVQPGPGGPRDRRAPPTRCCSRPTGKVVALIRVPDGGPDSFVLDVDAGFGEVVRGPSRPVPAPLQGRPRVAGLGVRRARAAASTATPTTTSAATASGVPVDWNGWRGIDLLGPGAGRSVPDRRGSWCGDEAWEACRIESGVPVMGRELDGDDPGRVRAGGADGQLHQGLLHGPGARRPHRRAGQPGGPPAVRPGARRPAIEPGGLVGADLTVAGGDGKVGRAVTSAAWCPGLGRSPRSPTCTGGRPRRSDRAGGSDGGASGRGVPLPLL